VSKTRGNGGSRPGESGSLPRRRLLAGLCGFGVGIPAVGRAQLGSDPFGARAALPPGPMAGDWLVFAYGDREGQVLTPDDLVIGAGQTFAFPQDPASRKIRNDSRLNQLIVVRLEPERLSERTRERSVDGIVAYSGVCSHTGCDVTDWNAEAIHFQCPCHESQFDPSDEARVVGGPAPWQLAALPLALVDGKLAAAGGFEGRLGFQQPGLDPFGPGL
jgi:rieske iron-sulfur protein